MVNVADEVNRLFETLNADDVRPNRLESGFKEFSVESKNELAARIARTFAPPPQGKLLARLPFILTEENKSDMATAFIANLRSQYPEARKFSLYGLEKLGHPSIADFALASLRDEADEVLVAACNILLPKAKQEPNLWKILQGVYATHEGKEDFHESMNFLKSHSVG